VSITAVQRFPITPVTLVASGGVGGPYTFSATGLPSGLSMASDGTISGTPTVSGTFSYAVTIKDKNGNAGTLNCSVTVNAPPSANCVSITAVQGLPITPVTLVASGGVGGPYTFSATGLPAGLSMAPDGTISGTPTVSGTFSYSVTIKDKNGNPGTLNCSVTVQANPATLIVVKKTTSASGDGTFTFTVGGAVSTTFSLTTANGTASTTLNNLQSGRYSLTEKTLSGWTQTSANCSDGSPISAINLQPGQTITCTITNSRAKYKTYTQGGWGTVPSGNNPGKILALYFAKLYSAGVSVGGGKIEKFTSQYAIQVYLPEGGTPYKLTANYTNPQPSVTGAGVLGAQTLTLRLNVDFSNAGIFPAGFPNLSYTASGPLYGKTVAQILSVANAALGGGALPPGVSYGDVATILGNINGNFDGGLINGGYLQ
jgi:Putative Ig domain/Prealbumin-like fold domain